MEAKSWIKVVVGAFLAGMLVSTIICGGVLAAVLLVF